MCEISIIIPVYNVEEYIEETLNSIKKQTFQNFEVILIDDGSTDKSRVIIKNLIDGKKNYKLIEQKNSGPSTARNKGLKEAKGNFIVFVDSDDILPENSLEVRYKEIVKNNADILLGGTYGYDGEKTWPIKTHFGVEGFKNLEFGDDLYLSMGPCNKIYKKSLVEDIKFPENLRYGEDQIWVMNAYLKAEKIFKINENVYYYRQRKSDNFSLTDLEKVNPNYVLEQVSEVIIRIFKDIDNCIKDDKKRNMIKEKYFERLLAVNIWPSFKCGITYGKEKTETFNKMENLLNNISDECVNKSEKLIWIVTQGIIDKITFLESNDKKKYCDFFKKIYVRINDENKEKIRKNKKDLYNALEEVYQKGNTSGIYKYLAKRRVKKCIKKVVLNKKIIFKIANVLPKKENLVILATNKGNTLEGNLKAINSEIVKENRYKVETFLAKDRGILESLKMDYTLGRAKYIIIDDYYRQIYELNFKKTEIIQVWHACGAFKKFGFSSIGKNDGNSLEFETKAHKNYTKVITSSKNIVKEYAEAFNIEEEKVLPIGVPRTDYLLNEEYRRKKIQDFKDKYPKLKDKKIILYAPTFRGNSTERKSFKLKFDPISLLNNISKEYAIVLKFHPSVKNGLNEEWIPKELKDRIKTLDSSEDINDLIINSEIVITDYSSVIFEAALLNKKMIMFAYDKEEYLAERDFYYEYESFVPGKIAMTNEEIVEIINKDKFNLKQTEEFKNKFFDHQDGQASRRFVENIFK